tara:strand:+ start:46 stop:534 length:489 start_codon:yes stop_codon:yes gene_type:complete
MALSSAEHEPFFVTTGTGKDKVSTDDLTTITSAWAAEKAEGCAKYIADPVLAPLIYQLQQMQDEINYLRTEISTNKDKATFPGFGTSGTTALVGNTALLALGTSGSTALAGDTNIVTIGSSTTIAFGDMVTVPGKGKLPATYNIVMTVTNGGVSKAITLTLT